MPIKYYPAEDVKKEAEDIVKTLNWPHIDFNNLGFLRSKGSTGRGTIARCHALGKAMQLAMGRTTGFYLIEVIHEKFDRLPKHEQMKTIIHELMHIPKTFGGGFIHHDVVCENNVDIVYDHYINLKINSKTSEVPYDVKKHSEQNKIYAKQDLFLKNIFPEQEQRVPKKPLRWF